MNTPRFYIKQAAKGMREFLKDEGAVAVRLSHRKIVENGSKVWMIMAYTEDGRRATAVASMKV